MKTTQKAKKLRSALSVVLVAVLTAVAVSILIGKFQNRVTFLFGKALLWVETDSMEPEIPAQSYILIHRAEPSDVQIGDIITFYSCDPVIAGKLNTHRVKDINNDHSAFITQGDHNPVEDGYVAPGENLVGIYDKNLPALTSFGRFFKTPTGLVVSLLLILVVCSALYLPDVIRAFRDEPKDPEKDSLDKQAEIDRLVAEEVEKLRKADQTRQGPPET